MASDSDLLSRYCDNRSEADFAELVRRHLGLVFSAALRQVADDRALAEDVAQQVFVQAARNAGQLRRRANIAGWLYTTTHFIAAKSVRTEVRRRAREQEAYDMQTRNMTGAHDEEWRRFRPVLDGAMHELNEREREAVLLRFFEKLPLAAVAQQLGVAENTATKQVERALDKLRARLSKRGITSTGAALGLALANEAVAAAPGGLAATIAHSSIAAAGVGATASAFSFMASLKPVLVTVGFAVLGGVALIQYQDNRALNQENAARRGEVEQLTREKQQAQRTANDFRIQQFNDQGELSRLRTASSAVPPAAPPAPAPVIASAAPAPRGRITVDFPNSEVSAIVGSVAELFRLNVVIPDALTNSRALTSIKLRDVSYQEIFQAVLAPVGYTYIEEGQIIKVIAKPQPPSG